MRIIGVIPARMASTRFPNKPMKKIYNIPMIGHCYFRSKMCKDLDEVYVATCDKIIYDYIESICGNAIMTSDKHERASDRTAEALVKIENKSKQKVDIVVMLQGDEPMITPKMISDAIYPLIKSDDIFISNLYANIDTIDEFNDPDEVKVVVDKNNYAIYFSREPIPSVKKGFSKVPMYKQVCIIPFKRDFLIDYNEMNQTPLEIIESVDMLRIIENGLKIKMVYTNQKSFSVDNLNDLKKVVHHMKDDDLIEHY